MIVVTDFQRFVCFLLQGVAVFSLNSGRKRGPLQFIFSLRNVVFCPDLLETSDKIP